jgi:hypothetical protein
MVIMRCYKIVLQKLLCLLLPSNIGCLVPSNIHVSVTCVNTCFSVLYTVCVTVLDDYLCTYIMVLRVFCEVVCLDHECMLSRTESVFYIVCMLLSGVKFLQCIEYWVISIQMCIVHM